jgi:hypothetical protein
MRLAKYCLTRRNVFLFKSVIPSPVTPCPALCAGGALDGGEAISLTDDEIASSAYGLLATGAPHATACGAVQV